MAAYDDPRYDDRDHPGAMPPRDGRPIDLPPAEPYRSTPEAPVETRRRSPVRWLLPLLLLLAVGFALARLGRNVEPELAASDPARTPMVSDAAGGEVVGADAPATAMPAPAGDVGAVQQFVAWANPGGSQAVPPEPAASHPYTAQGIRLLADALGAATAGGGSDQAAAVARIRDQAVLLERTSGGDRHAEYAHTAFLEAARLLGRLRGGEAQAELTAAASRVMPDRALGAQGERVRAFFATAARVMQAP